MHREWIRSNTEKGSDTQKDIDTKADWAEAWFAVDALMHRTCHVSAAADTLRSHHGSASEPQIKELLANLEEAHQQWRQRQVVRANDDGEKKNEFFHKFGGREQPEPEMNDLGENVGGSSFLDYTPMKIFNQIFASRLNNWRAIRLYISLIRNPMCGQYDGSRFVCALDLCRTYAALIGSEKKNLGAEKSVGLYLAGVVFGGPDMYAVISLQVETNEIERISMGARAIG
jgi:hypothetical protein